LKLGNLLHNKAQQAFRAIPRVVTHKVIHSESGEIENPLQIIDLSRLCEHDLSIRS
jgi:hypothetical protein